MVGHDCTIHVPEIKNGSDIFIGTTDCRTLVVHLPGKHFNWLQKKMMKWCFGWDVWDYSDA